MISMTLPQFQQIEISLTIIIMISGNNYVDSSFYYMIQAYCEAVSVISI